MKELLMVNQVRARLQYANRLTYSGKIQMLNDVVIYVFMVLFWRVIIPACKRHQNVYTETDKYIIKRMCYISGDLNSRRMHKCDVMQLQPYAGLRKPLTTPRNAHYTTHSRPAPRRAELLVAFGKNQESQINLSKLLLFTRDQFTKSYGDICLD